MANVAFAAAGVFMLIRMRAVRARVQFVQNWMEDLGRRWEASRARRRRARVSLDAAFLQPRPAGNRFFQILDIYIIREWFFYLVLMIFTFTGIYFIFDFFQLLGDVIHNHAGPLVVLNYYRYLAPQVLFFPAIPLAALVATLVSFGLLNKTNQLRRSTGRRQSLPGSAVFCGPLSAGKRGECAGLNQRQTPITTRSREAGTTCFRRCGGSRGIQSGRIIVLRSRPRLLIFCLRIRSQNF
jgi:hypothetical protein